jgi:hypothetical protein
MWFEKMSCRSRRRRVLAAALLSVALLAGRSWAGTVRGNISYRGELGPVGSRRPLCLCVFTDANLLNSIGCLIFRNNDVAYNLNLGNRDYYLIAFLDLQINEVLDPNEPFEIFAGRGAPPADPVAGESGRTDIDFTFGDENLPGTPTSSPTVTATSSYTPTSTRTQTQTRTAASSSTPTVEPTPTSTCAMPDAPACACVGDCDGDGRVAVNELVTAVRVALGIADASACVAGDANRDGVTQIGELVTAVRRSLTGC